MRETSGKKSRKKTGRQGIPKIKRNTEYEKKKNLELFLLRVKVFISTKIPTCRVTGGSQ